jgi:pyruvate,water dikinase
MMILQARPLHLAASKGRRIRLPLVTEPLVSGTCASSGKAVGRVRCIHSTTELKHFGISRGGSSHSGPSVLVLPQSIVEAARLIQNCVGVIIEVGNPTDHLSCIAREYGVPMITGADSALSCLNDGQWIMLDADQGVVVDAPESVQIAAAQAHSERQQQQASQNQPDREQQKPARQRSISPQRQKLRELVVPLNLTDAYGPTFSLQECKSIHDIVRYTHEMAVLAMFNVGDLIMEEAGGLLRPLEIGVPFDFLVIDVGGGIRQDTSKSLRKRLAVHKPLGMDDILSIPLKAFCEGLLTPGLSWHSGPDLDALSDIFSRTLLDARTARPAGSYNYALAARDYLNLNARVEFHFAMLDAICGRDSHANYIRFRFKGGGAGFQRGRRRAIFLRHVLESNAFYTTVADDLITASLVGASKEVVYERLVMLGRLMGFSRFLDGVMTDHSTPLKLAEAFLAGRFDSRNVLETEDAS